MADTGIQDMHTQDKIIRLAVKAEMVVVMVAAKASAKMLV
jgi:hypothetical protein